MRVPLAGRRWHSAIAGMALFSTLWSGPECVAQEAYTVEMDNAHCGKKFRIATHVMPPFVQLDVAKCVEQKCGPEAFGDDGGVVYKLMMEHVLPQLRTYCQESGFPEYVEFEWYIPPLTTDWTSSEKAVQMVCHGGFHSSFLTPLSKANPTCPAGYEYKGPSPASELARAKGQPTCDGAFLPKSAGCVSSGPDLVVGAVHMTGSRLDMLDFTVPFLAVDQLLVKRKADFSIETLLLERIDQVFTVFLPLTLDGWIAILLEIAFFTFIILMVEAVVCQMCNCCLTLTANDMVAPGFHGIVDSFYWGFSMAFDPGASGKYAITQGGKIYTVAHAFFMTIIAASYTGTVGPAIASSASAGAIKSFDTLRSGATSVAVVGPRWNADDVPPPYLGNHLGTSIPNPSIIVSESRQFKMLQSEMNMNSETRFSIITAETMHSYDLKGATFKHTKEQDPCSEEYQQAGVRLGVYDMVRCKSTDGKNLPHTTIFDAPQVVYEMTHRYNNTGECFLVAKGERFGSSSYGIGFPKNTSLPHIFSRAIERVKFKGQVDKLMREARLYDMDNKCIEPMEDSVSLPVSLLSGLFILVSIWILLGLLGSCLARHTCCGILPCSTLSDGDIRRTRLKDEERALAEAEHDMQEHKTVNKGRSSRMKHKVNVHHQSDDLDLGGPEQESHLEELGIDETYKPTFERKEHALTHMKSHPTTKQLLSQIHDDCERWEQHFQAIGAGADTAREKLLAWQLKKASTGHVTRGHARGPTVNSESADETISDDLVFADFHAAWELDKSRPRKR